MFEMFDEVFYGIADALDLAWYELFDSDQFDLVEERLVELYGAEILKSADYLNWCNEMAEDL